MIFLFLTLFALLFYNFHWKRRNLPPGPTPIPLFGNLLSLSRNPPGYACFSKWHREFGPVFTLWTGEVPMVIVAGWPEMKAAFCGQSADALTGRDFFNAGFQQLDVFFDDAGGLDGVVRSECEAWRFRRRWTMVTLRELGMGRVGAEEKIQKEVGFLFDAINQQLGRSEKVVMDIFPLIELVVCNVVSQLLFCCRFNQEHLGQFCRIRSSLDNSASISSGILCRMVLTMPGLRHIPPFSAIFTQFEAAMHRQFQFFDGQISQRILRRSEKKESMEDCLVDKFLEQIEVGQNPYFTMSSLRCICFELFGAGQETTSNTLLFLILYLILDRRVQRKMRAELDQLGKERIEWADHKKLPYINAVIQETQRLANIIPQNLPHRATQDVEIGEFLVPAGTRVVSQISAVLYDPEIFPHPERFLPERFLDEDGQLRKCEEFVPFSVGKRKCLGENLARMELFLFAANLFNSYTISVADPLNPPSIEKVDGQPEISPKHFLCCFKLG